MEKLAHAEDQEFLEVSITYGRIKCELITTLYEDWRAVNIHNPFQNSIKQLKGLIGQ